MPTQRKRIGFLPSSEVQIIIDKICKYNKLSQSRVTGILVEEALNYRGMLNSSTVDKADIIDFIKDRSLLIDNLSINNEAANNEEKHYGLDESNIKHEIQMINDFIEFKFFKKIMNKNNNIDKSVTL